VTGQAVYAVQQGETMSSIARQHNLTVGQLLLANPGFDRSTILYAGIHLNLPAANAAGPTANISPILGAPGDSVTVTAVGFSPNQLVRVGFGPLNGDVLQIDLTQVSPAGVLNRTYPLPGTATQDGLYVFVVQQADQPTVHAVSNLFTLAGTGSAFESGIPVTGSTSSPGAAVRSGTRGSLLTIFPTTAGAGDKITVTASGFPAGSHADVRITRSDKDEDFVGVIDAVASAAGRIETTIPVPASARFGETWVITVATTDRLVATTVESAPITIDR
jgi:LysM repeat protein